MAWADTRDDLVARHSMVERQIRGRGLREERVLAAMEAVPRDRFVPDGLRKRAYDDCPLPIGHAQTISQPYMVALMLECLGLTGSERVLEVGTGSGYQAALLAQLAKEVYTIERIPELAEAARSNLDALGLDRVVVVTGDGTSGLLECAPYDAIAVAAGAPRIPEALIEQLAEGGRLVVPVGNLYGQKLTKVVRAGGKIQTSALVDCAFVPLVGENAWTEEESERRLQ